MKGKYLIVNPLFNHPEHGWLTLLQTEPKSFCLCAKYAHQPRFDIKTYIMDYEEVQ